MEQLTINQRLKFLSEKLADSSRAFGLAIGDNSSNTHKYLNGATRPSPEYLEKVLLRFRNINAHWLLTGEGEPFISDAPETNSSVSSNKKISRSQVIGHVAGNASQLQGASASDQAAMQRENELLRSQVVALERTIQILLNQQPKP